MQLLLLVEGVTVILSVNYESVCYSLANNNHHYFEGNVTNKEKIKFGVDYLKKYINIPIHLYKTMDYDFYINKVISTINGVKLENEMESNGKPNRKQQMSKDVKTIEDDEAEFIKKVLDWSNKIEHITPREIKNILNMITLSKEIFNINNQVDVIKTVEFRKYLNWFFYHYICRDSSKKILEYLLKQSKKHEFNTVKNIIDEDEEFRNLLKTSDDRGWETISLIYDIVCLDIFEYAKVSQWFISNADYFVRDNKNETT